MSIQEEHRSIANNLAHIHGGYRLANERSGVILYMACPKCLHERGRIEFQSRHLAVMLDRWINAQHRNTKVATCMRCNSHFGKQDLLDYPTIETRGFRDNNKNTISFKQPAAISFAEIKNNVEIPHSPGECVGLADLPKTHPAWQYLSSRPTLDIERLVSDYNAAFCYKELPKNEDFGIFYKDLKHTRNTPQNRIVFYSTYNGILQAWQSRLIDKTVKQGDFTTYSYFHPDKNDYEVAYVNVKNELNWVHPYKAKRDIPPKYYNCRMHKHKVVFGRDAYLRHNKDVPYKDRYVVVTEGILDAVQFGGRGVACLGKQICVEQVPILLQLAPKIIFAVQNDKASESGFEFGKSLLETISVEYDKVSPPEAFNDFGEMDHKGPLRV